MGRLRTPRSVSFLLTPVPRFGAIGHRRCVDGRSDAAFRTCVGCVANTWWPRAPRLRRSPRSLQPTSSGSDDKRVGMGAATVPAGRLCGQTPVPCNCETSGAQLTAGARVYHPPRSPGRKRMPARQRVAAARTTKQFAWDGLPGACRKAYTPFVRYRGRLGAPGSGQLTDRPGRKLRKLTGCKGGTQAAN